MSEPIDAVVQLIGVTKRFSSITAVDRLTLDIRRGEFFSVLGPSGCGKTTTLRLLAGFEHPDEGDIVLDGRSVADVPPHRRNVNTVFQSYALFEHLNVWDNVAYGLRRRRVPRDEIRRRVGEMLAMVELADRAKARPAQLSGGQQQRVALARALVNKPAVLLLDEPLGALDLKLRRQMQIELKHLQRELGTTFVFVTHDQEEALTMSDRIAVMDGGVVRQCGTPADVYEHPASTFVARFLGTSNLLAATATTDGARLACGPHLALPLPPGVRPGDGVSVSLRPEKLELADDAEDGAVDLHGVLEEVVYLGAVSQLHVAVGADRIVMVMRNGGDQALLAPPVGSRLTLSFHPRHARVFASEGVAERPREPVAAE